LPVLLIPPKGPELPDETPNHPSESVFCGGGAFGPRAALGGAASDPRARGQKARRSDLFRGRRTKPPFCSLAQLAPKAHGFRKTGGGPLFLLRRTNRGRGGQGPRGRGGGGGGARGRGPPGGQGGGFPKQKPLESTIFLAGWVLGWAEKRDGAWPQVVKGNWPPLVPTGGRGPPKTGGGAGFLDHKTQNNTKTKSINKEINSIKNNQEKQTTNIKTKHKKKEKIVDVFGRGFFVPRSGAGGVAAVGAGGFFLPVRMAE